jgi:predicted AlkP superfamily pyrophosphatase or phosphodiesterase
LLVSDHGMTRISEPIRLEAKLETAGIRAETLRTSAVSHVFLEDPGEQARALSALASLEGARAYTRETLPDALRLGPASRVGDLVVIAEPPYAFRAGALDAIARGLGKNLGAHGYDPRHPDMAGVFFAMGRGAEPGGRLGVVSALDVAPSIAALLDIEPPRHAEGRPIPALSSVPTAQ